MDHSQALRVAAQPGVKLVVPDEMHQVTSAPTATGETDRSERNNLYDFLNLNGPGEAWQSGITGENVVVGVIDTGIWPEHPSFADDGSYPASPLPPLDETERSACRLREYRPQSG
jgi:subtilisin family serine protease